VARDVDRGEFVVCDLDAFEVFVLVELGVDLYCPDRPTSRAAAPPGSARVMR
jgi:hypothetical protein